MVVQSEKDLDSDTPLSESSEELLEDSSSTISSLYALLMLMTYRVG